MSCVVETSLTNLSAMEVGGLSAVDFEGLSCRNLCADSRQICPGDTFLAFPGVQGDGRHFIPQAIQGGAAHVLWESQGFNWDAEWRVPQRAVMGLRDKVSSLAGTLYGHPSHHLRVLGVTGTNGKTTCSHWLAQILNQTGARAGVLGTLGAGVPGRLQDTGHTTPDPIQVQRLLAEQYAGGTTHCVMEVSSHALDQGRVNGVSFRGALFTNLTRDHLDYHGSLVSYREAKARLFRNYSLDYALLNGDDEFGRELLTELSHRSVRVLGYSLQNRIVDAPEGLWVKRHALTQRGQSLELESPWGDLQLDLPVMGEFNVANLLAVVGAALLEGVSPSQLFDAVASLDAPPGRMEQYGGGKDPRVVVDFAHTPDALAQVLRALRPWVEPNRQLWVVFGCGGQRDGGKRPLMGRMAETWADRVVLTSDNPRDEDPQKILAQISAGMLKPPFAVEVDRGRAITQVLEQAQEGDVVLIAGKGHETTQTLAGGVKYPWSDRVAVCQGLAERNQ
ncbi:MAG: UDP-N-acetylmuramoyl-L-alanyl-D-glutamate--2,6-diaminopimelate ligase [Betaproteobacteria bacterium]|nr:UDP-N-acetylmuramoyl-L-alanyl-D-glutamate--2,6-diaminopimelate ligase [Betaproteobacteria bacterium]